MARIAGIVGDDVLGASTLKALEEALSFGARVAGASTSARVGRGAVMHWSWTSKKGSFANDRYAIVLDGTIVNRSSLPDGGDDAEVFARLFDAHGFEGAVTRIDGDFAVALLDASTDTLWLARDRFGVKPLYYSTRGGRRAFGSRPRALLALPWISTKPNAQFVALFAGSHYRTFDNAPDESPYADIAQLPAGCILRATQDQATVSRYWSLAETPEPKASEAELAERYRDLLVDAVRRRFEAADRPSFTLSGGLDSSSVLASAVRVSAQKQHAFSSVYDDATYDESVEIRSMLESTVKEWHQVRIGVPDVFPMIEQMIAVNDEPVATATWLSHFVLCGEVNTGGFGSLFGGLGGDELNAGEYEYFPLFFADLRAKGDSARLTHEIAKWAEYHDHPIYKKTPDVARAALDRLVDPNVPGRCLPDRGRLLRYASALRKGTFDLDQYEPVMDEPFHSYLKNRTFQDIFRETAPCCIRAADRQATAYGIEIFWPFFDRALVEFMFSVYETYKIRDGVTKHLLRLAMRDILPEETRTRVKKTGWNAPAHLWFSGRGQRDLLDLVHSQSFRERGIYDVDRVVAIINEHEKIVSSGQVAENHMMFLWQLVNLELWMRSMNVGG